MNYELAKQLKEAGYEGKFLLGELIEACGYRFRALMLHTENLEKHPEGKWHAKARKPTVSNKFKNQRGHTPEEAVAKLWLALNKS